MVNSYLIEELDDVVHGFRGLEDLVGIEVGEVGGDADQVLDSCGVVLLPEPEVHEPDEFLRSHAKVDVGQVPVMTLPLGHLDLQKAEEP